eukprot:scaffold21373_cov57-Attheya_sp.AAC.5
MEGDRFYIQTELCTGTSTHEIARQNHCLQKYGATSYNKLQALEGNIARARLYSTLMFQKRKFGARRALLKKRQPYMELAVNFSAV